MKTTSLDNPAHSRFFEWPPLMPIAVRDALNRNWDGNPPAPGDRALILGWAAFCARHGSRPVFRRARTYRGRTVPVLPECRRQVRRHFAQARAQMTDEVQVTPSAPPSDLFLFAAALTKSHAGLYTS